MREKRDVIKKTYVNYTTLISNTISTATGSGKSKTL